jgi:hypothetical protein
MFWYGTTGDCECGGRKDGVSSLEKMIFNIRHDHPSGISVRVALYQHQYDKRLGSLTDSMKTACIVYDKISSIGLSQS